MSKYKNYAVKVDTMARDAFKKVLEAQQKINDATEAVSRSKSTGATDPVSAAKRARAVADLEEAKAEYAAAKRNLQQTNVEISRLRTQLVEEIANDNRADPGQVDPAAMELLKSEILNSRDFAAMLDKYKDNVTMSRLIRKYAKDTAQGTQDTAERQRLMAVAMCENDNPVLNAFDLMASVSQRVEHNDRMINSWDELTTPAMKSFDR